MSRALTKAIRQSEMIGEAAFDATLQRKAAGGAMDFVPSGAEAGLAGWQDQQRYADRYNLFRGWIYSAINVLASEGAGQPIVVARLKGAKGGRSPKGRKALDLLRMTKTARSKTATTEHEILADATEPADAEEVAYADGDHATFLQPLLPRREDLKKPIIIFSACPFLAGIEEANEKMRCAFYRFLHVDRNWLDEGWLQD